jgi:nitrite reductase (NADH) small subunit
VIVRFAQTSKKWLDYGIYNVILDKIEFARKAGVWKQMLPFEQNPAATLVKIAVKSDLPSSGKVKEFIASGKMLCVANVNGEIHAMDNICLHWGGPLGQGVIADSKVVCPWHGWRFDPKTGEGPPKATGRLAVYKVKIEGDDVFVEM